MAERYAWHDDHGIWDNDRRCWIVWRTIKGTWCTSDAFKRALMDAINRDPACLAYARNATEPTDG